MTKKEEFVDNIDWSSFELPPEANQFDSGTQVMPVAQTQNPYRNTYKNPNNSIQSQFQSHVLPQAPNESDSSNVSSLVAHIQSLKAELEAKNSEVFDLHASIGMFENVTLFIFKFQKFTFIFVKCSYYGN